MKFKVNKEFDFIREKIYNLLTEYADSELINTNSKVSVKDIMIEYLINGEKICTLIQESPFSSKEIHFTDLLDTLEIDRWVSSSFGDQYEYLCK